MAKRSPDDGSNYRNAIREFETLFGLNPFFKRDDAWFCTGLCYAELGDRGNAKKYFLRSFLLGHKQEALDNYANMFWQENRIDTAASLMQISALNYPDAYTYNNLGVYYYQKGKWTRAIDYFTKAIDREPDLVNAWNNLLEIYRRRGDKAMVEKKTYQMITVFSRRGAQIQRGGARITASGAVDGDISDGR
jgi:tetratricopeptide (TPR) repeat protein